MRHFRAHQEVAEALAHRAHLLGEIRRSRPEVERGIEIAAPAADAGPHPEPDAVHLLHHHAPGGIGEGVARLAIAHPVGPDQVARRGGAQNVVADSGIGGVEGVRAKNGIVVVAETARALESGERMGIEALVGLHEAP